MAGNTGNYYVVGEGNACLDFFTGANNTNDDCKTTFSSKANTEGEREVISNIIEEAITMYGQCIDYYVCTYNLTGADNIYGEDTTTSYWTPVQTVAYATLNEDALTLSRFGFESDDELTLYVHISTFKTDFQNEAVWDLVSHRVEPKADDVFSLVDYGSDRPEPRGPKFFQVTEVIDSDINEMNALGGHYVWKVKAKRHEYSFEPGLSGEEGADQVYDNTLFGRSSAFTATEPTTGMQPNPGDSKSYAGDADQDVIDNTYDPSNVDNDVYGGY
tara:strand:- start:10127 stop:10945 length:819 start_codon:yes stop_codon:yes gene_type:complete